MSSVLWGMPAPPTTVWLATPLLGVYQITTKGHEFTATEDNKITIPLELVKQCQPETKNNALLSTSSGNSIKVRIGKKHHH